jgi:hypothetical protein
VGYVVLGFWTCQWDVVSLVRDDDEQIAEEIDGYLRELVSEAAKSEKPIPRQSNIYEEIVKKGWESVKRSRK